MAILERADETFPDQSEWAADTSSAISRSSSRSSLGARTSRWPPQVKAWKAHLLEAAGPEADDQAAVLLVFQALGGVEAVGARGVGHLGGEAPDDVPGRLLVDAEGAGREGPEIEVLPALEVVVQDLDRRDARQLDDAVVAAPGCPGHQVGAVAVEQAVGVQLPADLLAASRATVVDPNAAAGQDGLAQRLDHARGDQRARSPVASPGPRRAPAPRRRAPGGAPFAGRAGCAPSPRSPAGAGRGTRGPTLPRRGPRSRGRRARAGSQRSRPCADPRGSRQRRVWSQSTCSSSSGKSSRTASRMRCAVRRETPWRSWISPMERPTDEAWRSRISRIRAVTFSSRTSNSSEAGDPRCSASGIDTPLGDVSWKSVGTRASRPHLPGDPYDEPASRPSQGPHQGGAPRCPCARGPRPAGLRPRRPRVRAQRVDPRVEAAARRSAHPTEARRAARADGAARSRGGALQPGWTGADPSGPRGPGRGRVSAAAAARPQPARRAASAGRPLPPPRPGRGRAGGVPGRARAVSRHRGTRARGAPGAGAHRAPRAGRHRDPARAGKGTPPARRPRGCAARRRGPPRGARGTARPRGAGPHRRGGARGRRRLRARDPQPGARAPRARGDGRGARGRRAGLSAGARVARTGGASRRGVRGGGRSRPLAGGLRGARAIAPRAGLRGARPGAGPALRARRGSVGR